MDIEIGLSSRTSHIEQAQLLRANLNARRGHIIIKVIVELDSAPFKPLGFMGSRNHIVGIFDIG